MDGLLNVSGEPGPTGRSGPQDSSITAIGAIPKAVVSDVLRLYSFGRNAARFAEWITGPDSLKDKLKTTFKYLGLGAFRRLLATNKDAPQNAAEALGTLPTALKDDARLYFRKGKWVANQTGGRLYRSFRDGIAYSNMRARNADYKDMRDRADRDNEAFDRERAADAAPPSPGDSSGELAPSGPRRRDARRQIEGNGTVHRVSAIGDEAGRSIDGDLILSPGAANPDRRSRFAEDFKDQERADAEKAKRRTAQANEEAAADDSSSENKKDKRWYMGLLEGGEHLKKKVGDFAHRVHHHLRRAWKGIKRLSKLLKRLGRAGLMAGGYAFRRALALRRAERALATTGKAVTAGTEVVEGITVAERTARGIGAAEHLGRDATRVIAATEGAEKIAKLGKLAKLASKLSKLIKGGGPIAAIVAALVVPTTAAAFVSATAPEGEDPAVTQEKMKRAGYNTMFDRAARDEFAKGGWGYVRGAWQWTGIPDLWEFAKLAYNDPDTAKAHMQETWDDLKYVGNALQDMDPDDVRAWAKAHPEEVAQIREAIVNFGEEQRNGLGGNAPATASAADRADMPLPRMANAPARNTLATTAADMPIVLPTATATPPTPQVAPPPNIAPTMPTGPSFSRRKLGDTRASLRTATTLPGNAAAPARTFGALRNRFTPTKGPAASPPAAAV